MQLEFQNLDLKFYVVIWSIHKFYAGKSEKRKIKSPFPDRFFRIEIWNFMWIIWSIHKFDAENSEKRKIKKSFLRSILIPYFERLTPKNQRLIFHLFSYVTWRIKQKHYIYFVTPAKVPLILSSLSKANPLQHSSVEVRILLYEWTVK